MDSNIENRILACLASHPDGASDADLTKGLPDIDVKKRVMFINLLLKAEKLKLFTHPRTGKIIYKKYDAPILPDNVKVADSEEKLLYKIIQEAGNKGIWVRDIRTRSNLLQKQMNKVLRSLETKKQIKSVKSASGSKKKVYMLYDLEPDTSVTGGAWYGDDGFDSAFVDSISYCCYDYLLKKSKRNNLTGNSGRINVNAHASCQEVSDFINTSGVTNVTLEAKDINEVLSRLWYDGKIDRKIGDGGKFMYKAVESLLPSAGLMRNPCGVCPIFRNCEIANSVNPKTCTYLKDWLV